MIPPLTRLELNDTIDEGDFLEAFTDNGLGFTYITVEESERKAKIRLTPSQVRTLVTFLITEAE